MVCLSNDGWFWDQDHGRELHLMHARWRCAELGTPMVRSVNQGVSAFIDADGMIVERGINGASGTDAYGHRVEGLLSGEVRLRGGRTVYSQIGDLVPWGSFVMTGVLGVVALTRGRRGAGSTVTTRAEREAEHRRDASR
jgi:apolipoprotein N-acyltransferase